MSNPEYAQVKDFATVGDYIVEAVYIPNSGLSLTGLLVDANPYAWEALDRLERGYDRILIWTIGGEQAWMYVAKGTKLLTED